MGLNDFKIISVLLTNKLRGLLGFKEWHELHSKSNSFKGSWFFLMDDKKLPTQVLSDVGVLYILKSDSYSFIMQVLESHILVGFIAEPCGYFSLY